MGIDMSATSEAIAQLSVTLNKVLTAVEQLFDSAPDNHAKLEEAQAQIESLKKATSDEDANNAIALNQITEKLSAIAEKALATPIIEEGDNDVTEIEPEDELSS